MRLSRTAACFVVLQLVLVGCATHAVKPREYLDETTAATIIVVAEPWIFASQRGSDQQRDFLSLYAIDVNRMGRHRQYFAVLQWWPSDTVSQKSPRLILQTEDKSLSLDATREDPRALGISEPLTRSSVGQGQWWYFPVDKQLLATVAGARDLRASFASDGEQAAYTIWRDGREELTELTAVVP